MVKLKTFALKNFLKLSMPIHSLNNFYMCNPQSPQTWNGRPMRFWLRKHTCKLCYSFFLNPPLCSFGLKQKSGIDKDKDGTIHFLSLVTSIIKTKQILSHPAHANILFPVGETWGEHYPPCAFSAHTTFSNFLAYHDLCRFRLILIIVSLTFMKNY